MTNPTGPTYTAAQLRALALKAIDLVVTESEHHDLALSALLTAYGTIAVKHDCCHAQCAHATGALSAFLTKLAADPSALSLAPGPAQVH